MNQRSTESRSERPAGATPGQARAQAAGEPGVRTPAGLHPLTEGPYRARFARDRCDLEAVLRLRFEVFNRELGEGLSESWETGLDRDRFDASCHHLMLEDVRTGELVGTYRMQTAADAGHGAGFYCAQEFRLQALPDEVLSESVELGRACILREHRNGLALYTLWRGLAAYLSWSGKRYLFGCCSLTSQDPAEGLAMLEALGRGGHLSKEFSVDPRPEFACRAERVRGPESVKMPRLFGSYLRYGAKVCGPPAIDREFKTIDFFIVFDVADIPERVRRMFFSGLRDPLAGRSAAAASTPAEGSEA